MIGLLGQADRVLRGAGDQRAGPRAETPARLALIVLAFGLLYGAAMGTFAGVTGGRVLQVVYSSLKVPMLLMVTGGLSLPVFFVLYSLVGLRSDFHLVLRALLRCQAAITVILASLAPVTLLWYGSCADYQKAILFNAAMFGAASAAGQIVLARDYRGLIRRDPRHRRMLVAWIVIYGFVGIQMGWVLRPFIGAPREPVRFFREDSWGNAYVVVSHMLWTSLRR